MWIIQSNMNYENGVEDLKNYLKDNEIPHVLVDIFKGNDSFYISGTDEPLYLDGRNDILCIGSYRLSRMMNEKLISPGSFMNDNFTYSKWIEHWGIRMLNHDSIVQKISNIEIPDSWNKVFARPLKDNKLFTGGLFNSNDLLTHINGKILNEGNKDEKLLISSRKNITAEYRLFVVDGIIVTGSLYKLRNQLTLSDYVDSDVLDFANDCLDIWQPSLAFVLDIAITDIGCRIVEVNNIASAGLYKADVSKIVNALEKIKPH